MSRSATFVVRIEIPRETKQGSREAYYTWLWSRLGESGGLLGIYEGTVLSEQAAEQGFETESFTIDAAEAPRERDWIGSQKTVEASLYFESREQAEAAVAYLKQQGDVKVFNDVAEQPEQDWDREWKASFLNTPDGVRVPPDWRILPPWVTAEEAGLESGELALRINPGAGFGTGTHETTQLCLEAIGALVPRGAGERKVLDFGSGSGILSIGAALRGARVWAVEIDPLANDNAADNAQLNGVTDRIQIRERFEEMEGAPARFDLVVANILRPVLEAFAGALVSRMREGGGLVLSGLVAEDLERIIRCYSPLLPGRTPRTLAKGEWRCIVWD